MKVVWRRRARLDRLAIQDFLEGINPQVAADTTEALVLAADSLMSFPNRGRHGLLPGTRELVSVWPYIVVYDVAAAEVVILRIWHGAQRRE